jgi:hypothetical protein
VPGGNESDIETVGNFASILTIQRKKVGYGLMTTLAMMLISAIV